MLLKERDDEARKRNARAVKRMDELRLAVGVFEAAVEAARLVVGEARARADLKPLLLAGSPELQVVALRGGEAHVAGREHDHAERKAEPRKDFFRFLHERLELLERDGRMHEVHHLDLVELVDAQHAARHLARRPRLAAEARSVGRELDGALGGDLREVHAVKDVVAVVVRDRHLGRRNQPEVVDLAVVEVFSKLRELASAGHRVAVHDERRQHLGISLLLAVEVEHVLDERALEFRALAENHGEARARELHAAREVEDAELFADLDVRRDLEVGVLPLADHPDDLVRRAVGAGGDLWGGDVRDHQKRLAEIVVDLRELLVDLGYAVADLAHLVLRGRDVSA